MSDMTDEEFCAEVELSTKNYELKKELDQTKQERDQYQSEKWKYGEQIGNALKILEAYPGDMEVLNQIRKVLTQK